MKFTSLENLQYFLSKLSYVSKESGILNSIITSYLNDFKRDVVQIVSELPNPGETGVLYLVPQGNNHFIEYYYNNGSYIQVGSSVFDVSVDSQLSNASENTLQNKVISSALDLKLDSSQLVNALNNTSSETPQSQVLYDAFGNKIDSDDFLSITNSDIGSLFLLLPDGSEIFCSTSTTWYLTENGDLYGCGDNTNGQLGFGNAENSLDFVKIASGVKNLKCSSYTTWYLTENGDLYGCGKNDYGQQGSGDTSTVKTFTKRAENVKDFYCSDYTAWYIDNNNNLYGCGKNDYGQQSSNDTTNILRFTYRRSGVRKVVAEDESTWCINNNDELYCCGNNDYGQLGKGNSSGDTKRFGAGKVGSNVKDIFINPRTARYLTKDNTLFSCGAGRQGQQSDGYLFDQQVFHVRAYNVKKVATSSSTMFYIDSNGNLYGCGANRSGQQGNHHSSGSNSTDWVVKTFTKINI